jgi:short-subunit dehydrogenase
MTNLRHKTVLITGATSGIGKAIAFLLAKKECNLVCVGRNRERLENLKNEIKDNISFDSFECDITYEKEIIDLIERISDKNIKIDILIHSAGIIRTNSVFNSTIEEYNLHFNLNVKAPYLITKLFLSNLIENKGQVVFINSSVIQQAKPNQSLYSASKCALMGFTDSLRQEVNEFGVRVIAIYPGKTASPMQQALYENENKHYNSGMLLQTSDVASIVVNALELSKTAEVTDLFIRPLMKN